MLRGPLALTLVLGALAAAPSPAAAAQFTVNTTTDAPDEALNGLCDTAGPGVSCTLRAALQEANSTAASDVISLPDLGADYDLSLAGTGEDAAATGDLDVTRTVTVEGTGQPVIDGAGVDRVFHVGPSNAPTLSLAGLEVRGGGGVASGGGILVDAGALLVDRSTIAGNAADSPGGTAEGGGVRVGGTGSASFKASTLSGNTASGLLGAQGGGVMLDDGADAAIESSTISLNQANSPTGGTGGGVAAAAPGSQAQLLFTTLRQNSATGPGAAGGSLAAAGGGFTLHATIIASGSASPGSGNCSGASFQSLGRNMEAPAAPGSSQCGLFAIGPLFDRFAFDDGLADLADRGGPTQTHALLSNSVALDAYPSCAAGTDQRGQPRPSGSACDIGSFERQIVAPAGVGCFGRQPTILGTAGKDTLVGGPGADVILGQGGHDLIKGRGGNDLVCAGKGSDRVYGGAGNDRLAGQDGKDRLFGQAGSDDLLGNAGKDFLSGGGGRDSLNGGGNRDNCRRGDRSRHCE